VVLIPCPDCWAEPGWRHHAGCEVAFCAVCGLRHLLCSDHLAAPMQVWSGELPAEAGVS
jgi:hypothetical protein